MQKGILGCRRGDYRKSFICISVTSLCFFIYSSITKDVSSILIWLGVCLAALKQVAIPIDLNQKIFFSKKRYSISDDDFIKNYNSKSIVHNGNHDNIWHKIIILGEKLSSFLLTAGILYIIFT